MAEQDEGGQPTGTRTGGSSAFLRKLGPLPVWAWMAVGLGLAIAFSSWRKNKTTAAANTNATTDTSTTATDTQTPPFIIQNYTQAVPGAVGPAGPPGAPGAPGAPGSPGVAKPPPVSAPPATPPSKPPPVPPKAKTPIKYKVLPGDNLSAIAGKFGIPGGRSTGWKALWSFNTNTANRKAAGLPAVQGNNPNLIYPGEVILIPQS